ncbi:MAG: acetylornithine/succinylornithine family transaminase [Clostridia bacterium]|nr:acetylornithine/succinylornithine family transaminase [Clostridia bacterium]
MDFETVQQQDKAYLAGTYRRFPVCLTEGSGATLKDETGKEYIDFGSGIGVNAFGVGDEVWKNAVIEQVNRIQHASNLYYTQPQVRLAQLLIEKTGAKKVFFGNSGAEANECAIKVARKYSFDRYGEGRYEIVTLKNSFHGRTIATLSATGQDALHTNFMPFLEGFTYAEPTISDLERHLSPKTCAVMLELVQGESGVRELDRAFVDYVAEICKERDILLIVDEVQTGNGRTGKLYAYQHYGITPDVVTTAKGLGGGLPLGACMMFERTQNVLVPGSHGSTFGGNPVCCAGAYSVLSRLTDEFLLEVQGKAAYLRTHLNHLPNVEKVTGIGLMIGLQIKDRKASEIAAKCLERGLLVLTAHERVRLLPPLCVTKREMDDALNILKEVLS